MKDTRKERESARYPILIFLDRYDGTYTPNKHRWVALSGNEAYCLKADRFYGPNGDDTAAKDFWRRKRDRRSVATGKTPHQAYCKLMGANQ